MSNPLKHHLEWARHLVGYMCSTRNFSLLLKWQYIGSKTQQLMHGDFPEEDGEAHCLETYTDSDWAGSADRKTVSSICVFLDGNLIHSFTRKQQSRALSSCEGEFTACTAIDAPDSVNSCSVLFISFSIIPRDIGSFFLLFIRVSL